MTLTAGDLILDAQALCYPNVDDHMVSKVALLRQLTSLDEKVIDLLTITAPQRVSAAASNLNISLANNLAGYSLTAARSYHSFQYFDKDSNWINDIRIVPERKFDHPPVHPAGIVRGSTFFPCDPMENRWSTADQRDYFRGDGDTIRYRLITSPAVLTALTQTLASPDEARQYFVWSLVMGILLQAGGVTPERLQVAAGQIAEQEGALRLMASKRVPTQASLGA